MSTLTEKRNLLQEVQEAFNYRGLGSNPSRKQAFDLFQAKGFPSIKSEEYKFTPITRTLEKSLSFIGETPAREISPRLVGAGPNHASLQIIGDLKCNVIAFVNGEFSREKSIILDSDIKIQSGENNNPNIDSDPFDLLNHAFSTEMVQINIDSKKSIHLPLVIVYYFDSPQFVFANPRWHCRIGVHSSVSVIEYVHSTQGAVYFNNKQSIIEVGENSEVDYTSIQNGPTNDIQLNNTLIHLSTSARASCYTFTFDGQLIRNNLTLTIDGEGIDVHLYGLYLLSKNSIVDNHTVVDHHKPNSFSNELYKGVMDGSSKGIFNGKIYVRPHAQKTNAFQSNRNILLGENATINTKPQLEIWADDVKCSHGCTTGQLDDEALFYLRSRGISKEMAKGMMLYAFATETLSTMKNETVKNFIDGLISENLNKTF